MLYATHILNRLPTLLLNWKTPFEIMFNRNPDYSSFKIFGCLCYALNLNPSKSKLETRAHKSVFLGQANHHKSYQLLNLDSNIVFVSRDAKFYESIYLLASKPTLPEFWHPTDNHTSLKPKVTSIESSDPILRPAINIHKPFWLHDFICTSSNPQSTNDYRQKVNEVIDYEPVNFNQASKIKEWQDAMQQEITTLDKNQIREIVALPLGVKSIVCKGVCWIKRNLDGSIVRFKAKLVAKGFLQVYG